MADSQPPEGLQPKISDDEQSRHPQAFQVLHDTYRYLDCPTAVDPVDPDDCASVAEESVRVLMQAGLLLPSGGEVSTQWSVRKDDPWGVRVVMEPSTEEEAREYFADQLRFEEGSHRRPAELVHRQVTTWEDGSEHYLPWSPVLSDNTEGQPQ